MSACFDQVSHIAKAHVAALQELLEQICRLKSKHAQHVIKTEPDDHSSERELTSTMEKLRLAEEEVFTLHRNLDQSKRAMCGIRVTHGTSEMSWTSVRRSCKARQTSGGHPGGVSIGWLWRT